ncbi:MAG: radical SAM protein [Candidatus Sumerlaeota bacterium]|nr:radical SAM protein [Candidatus Sumerlaeota bacterium]
MSDAPPQRAMFIVPPTGKYIREDRCQTPIKNLKTVALRPPIDLLYAAAAFRSAARRSAPTSGAAECRLVDYPGEERSWDALEADLRAWTPDILVMSITTPSFEDDMQAARAAKGVSPRIRTVAKGAHFNTLDRRALEEHPELDVCLRGEYEETCMDLARGLPMENIAGLSFRDAEGRIHRNPDRPLVENLDALPFPARDLCNNDLYIRPDTGERQTTIVTNRGCPFSCIFCLANQVSGNRNRVRSADNILDEIVECVERHRIRSFLFRSDLFTADRAWVRELCQAILDRGLRIEWGCNSRVDTLDEPTLRQMKQAGCWLVAFGVESGSQASLDRMRKKAKIDQARPALDLCRRVGVRSSIYFLMGLPWDTRESIEADMRFARAIDPDYLEIFYVYPFPGTALYEMAVAEGLLGAGTIPKAAYDAPAMPTQALGLGELEVLRRRFMRDFYLRPRIILRTLGSCRSPRELFNYVKYGAIQLWDLFKARN